MACVLKGNESVGLRMEAFRQKKITEENKEAKTFKERQID